MANGLLRPNESPLDVSNSMQRWGISEESASPRPIVSGVTATRPAEARSLAWRAILTDRIAVWILLLALLLRLVLLAGAERFDLKIQDERHYYDIARNLLEGNGFAIEGRLTSLRPPLYPGFLAAIWAVSGEPSLMAVRLVQIAISLLNCVLLYHLGQRLFNRRVALLAMTGRALYPSFLYSDLLLLTEVLFTFLLTAFLFAYVALLRSPGGERAYVVGLLLGLAALTRSVLWPFPFVLVPLLVYSAGGRVRTRLALSAALLLGYATVIAPWAVRNTRLQGTTTIVDTMGGLNLLMGNYAHTPDERMWAAVGLGGQKGWSYELIREHPDASGWSEGRKEQWAKGKALEFMSQHPGLTLRRAAIKFADFWGLEREFAAGVQRGLYPMPRWLAWGSIVAVGISYPLVVLLAAVGLFLAAPSDTRVHLFLLAVILFVCGVHTVVFGHSRYHLPLVPVLLLYAGSAVNLLVTARPWRPERRLIPAAAVVAVLLGIWMRELFSVDAERLRRLLEALA